MQLLTHAKFGVLDLDAFINYQNESFFLIWTDPEINKREVGLNIYSTK